MSENADYALYHHLAAMFAGTETDTVTKLCLGNSSAWYAADGLGVVTASTIEYLNTTAHPHCLHLGKTFTNSGTSEHQITKIGVYDSNATPNLLHTYTLSTNEIPNFGYIPPGESIEINMYISMVEYSSSLDILSTVLTMLYRMTVSVSFETSFDPADFTPSAQIEYNGIELPNAHIVNYTESLGGKSWSLKCYTTDLTLIDQITRYASPLKTGAAVSGYQYVISPYRSGSLMIRTSGTHTWVTYNRCFISGPINVEPFGLGYWFNVNVVQSYFEDQT